MGGGEVVEGEQRFAVLDDLVDGLGQRHVVEPLRPRIMSGRARGRRLPTQRLPMLPATRTSEHDPSTAHPGQLGGVQADARPTLMLKRSASK